MADLQALADAVIQGNQTVAVQLTEEALKENISPKDVLENGLIAGMGVVGVRFKANEVFIPEVLISARAMKSGMEILEPKLAEAGIAARGKALIGTVQGDLHDIGKNLVVMMLKGAGFAVEDIGVDQSPAAFVEKIKTGNPHVVGLSALLTTTMPAMGRTVDAIRQAGLNCRIMVGGAPVTQAFADKIGADGYAGDAPTAVDVATEFLNT